MATKERKSASERAKAHDDLVSNLETIRHDLWEVRKFCSAQRNGSYEQRLIDVDLARSVEVHLDDAVDSLGQARRLAAIDAYDTRRAADIETGGPHGQGR